MLFCMSGIFMRLVTDVITSVLFDMAPATLIMAEDNQGRGREGGGRKGIDTLILLGFFWSRLGSQ